MKVLVTGANGFVGRNLSVVLGERKDCELVKIDVDNTSDDLRQAVGAADVIVHLAGANRPPRAEDFTAVNAELTKAVCAVLEELGRAPRIIFASSIQAAQDNPYGASKLAAEKYLQGFSSRSQAEVIVHRLPNLFGKWCRPNYNSVTATFCHNVAHDLPLRISDPDKQLDLVYIDDVIDAFVQHLDSAPAPGFRLAPAIPSHRISLGALADTLRSFRSHRATLELPDFGSRFMRALYATYVSYLEPSDLGYTLPIRSDNRGDLAEFLKSDRFGQIFVSRTKPGITRGNHFHHTKAEKFLVLEGEALIRLRHLGGNDLETFRVRGSDYRVVDIPPGYAHSIQNVGATTLVTLFWSTEVFDPSRTDTTLSPVEAGVR